MHASEHAIINDLLAEHAVSTATTAEDQLVASWRRDVDRLRHETPARRPDARRGQGAPGFEAWSSA
jgi:hypothetical protein